MWCVSTVLWRCSSHYATKTWKAPSARMWCVCTSFLRLCCSCFTCAPTFCFSTFLERWREGGLDSTFCPFGLLRRLNVCCLNRRELGMFSPWHRGWQLYVMMKAESGFVLWSYPNTQPPSLTLLLSCVFLVASVLYVWTHMQRPACRSWSFWTWRRCLTKDLDNAPGPYLGLFALSCCFEGRPSL